MVNLFGEWAICGHVQTIARFGPMLSTLFPERLCSLLF